MANQVLWHEPLQFEQQTARAVSTLLNQHCISQLLQSCQQSLALEVLILFFVSINAIIAAVLHTCFSMSIIVIKFIWCSSMVWRDTSKLLNLHQ